jgi:hypothetical protein
MMLMLMMLLLATMEQYCVDWFLVGNDFVGHALK